MWRLELTGITKRYPGVVANDGVGLRVAPGEIHGFDAMVWRPAAREKWAQAHAFLAPRMSPMAPEPLTSATRRQ